MNQFKQSVWLGIAVGLLPWMAGATETPLADIDRKFVPSTPPIQMEYQVSYRFLSFQLARIGKIRMDVTTGTWPHRVTGAVVPAVFVDVRLDSSENPKESDHERVSIHDRIVAVLKAPELEALYFAKLTDERINPVFGRNKTTHSLSWYDTQAGRLEYQHRDLDSDATSTNLANPEALLKLSRQLKPVMDYLLSRYTGTTNATLSPGAGQISVNVDGTVIQMDLLTRRERSPTCFERQRVEAMRVETVPEKGARGRIHSFYGWAIPFDDLAALRGDETLSAAAREAVARTVVPLAVDYELGLGRIRATILSVKVGTGARGG